MIKEINLTEFELFQSLLEIEINNVYYDLHNDYDCFKLFFAEEVKEFLILFKKVNNVKLNADITLKFENVLIRKLDISLQSLIGNITIDNFYRGRFEEDGILKEFSEDRRSYFYLEFYEGWSIELLSKNVRMIIDNDM